MPCTQKICWRSTNNAERGRYLTGKFYLKNTVLLKCWFINWCCNLTPWQKSELSLFKFNFKITGTERLKLVLRNIQRRRKLAAKFYWKVILKSVDLSVNDRSESRNGEFWKRICKVFYASWKSFILCEYSNLKWSILTIVKILDYSMSYSSGRYTRKKQGPEFTCFC